jgi:hypothetical protein
LLPAFISGEFGVSGRAAPHSFFADAWPAQPVKTGKTRGKWIKTEKNSIKP